MNFSDETLMAYADGELAEPERSAVERAMREDPAVAAAVERHRALRTDVFAAFSGVLDEPVPARLQPRAGAAVHSFEAARQARSAPAPQPAPAPARWTWAHWGGMAAALVLGVLTGGTVIDGTDGDRLVADAGGRLVAGGPLATALSSQLASEGGNAAVRIGTTFASKDGGYCRSFQLPGRAGLACREGDAWRIPVLKETGGDGGQEYRQASSGMPAAVLEAIDERIAGEALDAVAERAARERGWQR